MMVQFLLACLLAWSIGSLGCCLCNHLVDWLLGRLVLWVVVCVII